MLPAWLLFHYFLLWLEWLPQAPLLPSSPADWDNLRVAGWNFLPAACHSRLFLYALTLPFWLCWLETFQCIRISPRWPLSRFTLSFYSLVLLLFCLSDLRRWNGWTMLLLSCSLIAILRTSRALPWIKAWLASYLILSCLALSQKWWLGGTALEQQLELPGLLAWPLWLALLGGAFHLSARPTGRGRAQAILPATLALFYLSCLGGNGAGGWLLALGLSLIVWLDQTPCESAPQLFHSVLLIGLGVLWLAFPGGKALLPLSPIDPPVDFWAEYRLQRPGEDWVIRLERHPRRGWLSVEDRVTVRKLPGRARPLESGFLLDDQLVFHPRRFQLCPGSLLSHPACHTSWAQALLQKHPDWKVTVQFQWKVHHP